MRPQLRTRGGFTPPKRKTDALPFAVYRPPESDRGGKVIVYAGKAHPQLTGADLVATYAANSLDFSQLVQDSTLYYPRIVRITIE